MTSFVRKEFYLDPPAEGASEKEWQEWIRKDDAKARAAKAAHTKATQHEDMPDHLVPTAMVRGPGGVWQQAYGVGFTGSAEDGTLQGEVIDHTKDTEVSAMAAQMESRRHKRGGSRAGKAARQRRRRARRKAKGK